MFVPGPKASALSNELDLNGKIYFSIGEVAQMLGVTTSLIRFWETEFGHIKPRKNTKGDRRYTKREIEDIRQIYQLTKEKGYTLQGAKDYIKNKKGQKSSEAIETLQRIKDFLIEIKENLPQE